MIFCKPNATPASILRGDQIAQALGVPCLENSLEGAQPGEAVVFVKTARQDLIEEAGRRGCRIVWDVVDWLCYPDRWRSWMHQVDVGIAPNATAAAEYAAHFPKARWVVIPHQWDVRISGHSPMDCFRPGYIGAQFNAPLSLPELPMVTDDAIMVSAMTRFNCHVAMRLKDSQDWYWKPATKLASAAGAGANIVTKMDCSTAELLPSHYPYAVRTTTKAALDHARDTFGGPEWMDGLEMMAEVRERTALATIAKSYENL